MRSITPFKSLAPSVRVRRVIAGPVGRAAPHLGTAHYALRRAERPAPCRPACHRPFCAWSARPRLLRRFLGHVLPEPGGSARPAISTDIVACWKYMPTLWNCRSNDKPPLPLLLENHYYKANLRTKSSTYGAGGLAPPPTRGSALECSIRSGTMAILTGAFAPLSALALYARGDRAVGPRWVWTWCLWLAAGSGSIRCRSPPWGRFPLFEQSSHGPPGGTHV